MGAFLLPLNASDRKSLPVKNMAATFSLELCMGSSSLEPAETSECLRQCVQVAPAGGGSGRGGA